MNPRSNSSCISQQEVSLKSSMRLVWEQHVYWTRLTIISLAFNLPDVDFVTARLLRNATDMGNLLKPYYGNRIAAKFSNLIREHLVIAVELVKAAKAGDQIAVAAIEKRWYANGKEIAEFLSTINPFISKKKFKEMFFEHLALTTSEAVFILQQDFKSSIAVFDKIEVEALQMADTITVGIVKQFPKKFKYKSC
ncbi:acetylglutamate kinase [Fictibacillus sp. WQ 8-8]|uniref:acetylglutamate kinase n=1 Tax=unclassified Fictibacillus TaxID=2644029 RepID=UPI002109E7EA|nr:MULTISPECIES: acetylglutamate kinase [unclassified Fictibacillus]MCQ6268890.1 acetylglutamate kinase [Fictibacillus sp. WQ 8-8]MED2972469.1 acetylglutamate kinase [Fictibacillus sp. B-59209]